MAYSRLRRSSDARKALLRDLVTDLILNGQIETTVTKAKELKIPVVNEVEVAYNLIKDKAKIVAISVNPVNDSKAKSYRYYVTDSQVVNFNNSLKSQLNNSIYYCDVYSKIINNFDTTDGLHYTNDTYKKIYDEIRKCLK